MSKEEILSDEYSKLIMNWEKAYRQHPLIFQAAHSAMAIYAKETSIAFAEWIADGPWIKYPPVEGIEKDLWYLPSDDINIPDEQVTSGQLYTLFLQTIKS